jgi:hypothetical protein
MILKRIDVPGDGERYVFYCPGCKRTHTFFTNTKDEPRWNYNGHAKYPTFNPSLVSIDNGVVCHLHLDNGVIRFLKECTHDLRNQDVSLMDLPDSD